MNINQELRLRKNSAPTLDHPMLYAAYMLRELVLYAHHEDKLAIQLLQYLSTELLDEEVHLVEDGEDAMAVRDLIMRKMIKDGTPGQTYRCLASITAAYILTQVEGGRLPHIVELSHWLRLHGIVQLAANELVYAASTDYTVDGAFVTAQNIANEWKPDEFERF